LGNQDSPLVNRGEILINWAGFEEQRPLTVGDDSLIVIFYSRAEKQESLTAFQSFFLNDGNRCEESVTKKDCALEFGVQTPQSYGCPFEYAQLGDHSSHQRLNQCSMGHPFAERRFPGERFIHVQRIEIA